MVMGSVGLEADSDRIAFDASGQCAAHGLRRELPSGHRLYRALATS